MRSVQQSVSIIEDALTILDDLDPSFVDNLDLAKAADLIMAVADQAKEDSDQAEAESEDEDSSDDEEE